MKCGKFFLWAWDAGRRLATGGLFLLAAGLPVEAGTYWIEGTSSRADGRMLYVRVQGRTVDSVRITSGRFKVACRPDETASVTFSVGPCQVEVVTDGPAQVDFDRGWVSGTPENDALSKWSHLLQGYQEQMDTAAAQIRRLLPQAQRGDKTASGRIGEWQQTYSRQEQLWREALMTCLRDNGAYYFPAVFLQRYPDAVSRDTLLKLAQLQPRYLQGEAMRGLRRDLEVWRLRQPGQPLPDLTLPDAEGHERALSSFVSPGHYVLISFWAGWCGDCRAEMKRLCRLYSVYRRRGLEMVGVSLDTDAAAWRRAVRTLRLPWAQLSDLRGWQSRAVARYGLNRIPDCMLVGPDGRIVADNLTMEALEARLQQLWPDD